MQFLYPNVLWALTAIAIPVIIHFFNLHRYQIVPFSNTQFVKALQTEQRSRSTIRKWLLLALRILVIAFAVMAFARPYIPQDGNRKSGNLRVAVYVDNSFSMEANGEYGVLLEWAKTMARNLTDLFPPHTEFLLMTNEMEPQQQRWVSKEQYIDWVQNIRSTHLVTNIDEVLSRQQTIGRDSTKIIYSFILSDLHKPAFMLANAHPIAGQRVFVVPFENKTQNNLSIDSVWFSSPGLYPGKVEEMTVRVRNYGREPVKNQSLQVYVNDTLKNAVPFSVDAKGASDVKCTFLHGSQGWSSGRVEIQDYPITFDNQLYFAYDILPQTKVLRISAEPIKDYFSALYASDKNVGYSRVSPFNVQQDKLFDYQFVIVDTKEPLSSGLTDILAQYVAKGGHLALLPLESAVFDNLLKATEGPKLTDWIEQDGKASNLNTTHSLFRDVFSSKESNYSMPTYKGYFKVEATSRQRVERLFDTESGDYLQFAYGYGSGKVYVLAVPFASELTNLMFHPAFVPLYYNMALQSTSAGSLYSVLRQDMQVDMPMFDLSRNLSLASDSGTKIYPAKRIVGNGIVLYPNVAEIDAGAWTVESGAESVGKVSFNYDRKESVQQFWNADEVLEQLSQQGFDAELVKASETALTNKFAGARSSDGLWRWFVAFALLCLVAEELLLKKK